MIWKPSTCHPFNSQIHFKACLTRWIGSLSNMLVKAGLGILPPLCSAVKKSMIHRQKVPSSVLLVPVKRISGNRCGRESLGKITATHELAIWASSIHDQSAVDPCKHFFSRPFITFRWSLTHSLDTMMSKQGPNIEVLSFLHLLSVLAHMNRKLWNVIAAAPHGRCLTSRWT